VLADQSGGACEATGIDCQRDTSQIAYGWICEFRTDVAAKANPEPADMAAANPPAESTDMAAAKANPQPADMAAPNLPAESTDVAAKPRAEPTDMAAAKAPAESADMITSKTAPTHATPEPAPSVTASSPAPRRRNVRRRSEQCSRNGEDDEPVQQRSLPASPRDRSRSRRMSLN
jgi:hypothetical protein